MSNYIEYDDRVAFHPGYYIKEIIDDSGLTQEDFARRLGTTPKNISILVRGEQSISIDIATKLSRLLGTTIAYWLGLQQAFDEKTAEFLSLEELKREREVFKMIDYRYYRDYFGLPDLPRNVDEQIKKVREFLSVSSLSVLEGCNLSVDFKEYENSLSMASIVNLNAMMQIAINKALETDAPRYNKKRFEKAAEYALTLKKNPDSYLPEVKKEFQEAGVALVVLPETKDSVFLGATKKVDGKIMMMVNERNHSEETFRTNLFNEVDHVLSGSFGITFKDGIMHA